MDTEDIAVKNNVNKQPKLKKYFIAITLILVLAIMLGQSYQDFQRKQEHLDYQRIHSHRHQAELVVKLMNSLLVLRDYEHLLSGELLGTTKDKLLHGFKEVSVTQDSIIKAIKDRRLLLDDKLLAIQEQRVSTYIDDILLITIDILASVESETVTQQSVENHYQLFLSNYVDYYKESEHFIENLSNYLEEESYENRMVLWGVVIAIILLVIIVGFVFYRFVSSLVNREFFLLAEENSLQQKSEQEMAQHAKLMAEHQMKMRSILDSTVEAIITITADGKIDSFNKAAVSMFGYPAEFAIGKNVKILMPDDVAAMHDVYLHNYLTTGEQKIIGSGRELVAKRVDGITFPIHLSVSEVTESEPKLFTGIIQDITARKKSEETLKQTMSELRNKQVQLEDEEQFARHVFEALTASNNDTLPELSSWCEPMGTFSGDMMLSTLLPSGALRVILCDFTGHGLPAALGAVPVSTIHTAMAQKGLPLDLLMGELNSKLKSLLPTGIFCCIAGIDIDSARTHAHIWNAGLPEVLIVSNTGKIKQRIKSVHLPLGVADYDTDEMHCVDLRLEIGDMVYLYSDGLTEAENEAGEMFGQQRFEQLLTNTTDEDGRLVEIRNQVINYMGKMSATDDISIVEIKTLS